MPCGCGEIIFYNFVQWRNKGFRRPGAEAVKCTSLPESSRESDASSPFLVKYTTVVVPSRQLPCNSVIFLWQYANWKSSSRYKPTTDVRSHAIVIA